MPMSDTSIQKVSQLDKVKRILEKKIQTGNELKAEKKLILQRIKKELECNSKEELKELLIQLKQERDEINKKYDKEIKDLTNDLKSEGIL
jgi:hypothetical protein